MKKRVLVVKTFDDFMRNLRRENYKDTIVIVKERPTHKARIPTISMTRINIEARKL